MIDLSIIVPSKTDPYPFTPDQEAWLTELETTEKAQGRGWLEADGRFCCLGIACALFGLKREKREESNAMLYIMDSFPATTHLPMPMVYRLRMRGAGGNFAFPFRYKGAEYATLTAMNDMVKGRSNFEPMFTFKDIAAYIRHDPWNVFYGPNEANPDGVPLP